MMIGGAEPLFLDTNVLVYASWDRDPLHEQTLLTIREYEAAGTPLVISRQVLRELLATLARPRTGIAIKTLTAQVRLLETRYHVLEDGAEVTANLLTLLDAGLSTQIHDTNIVATMQVGGIKRILTNNPDDFAPFAALIDIVRLT